MGKESIVEVYRIGRGKVKVRFRVFIEELLKGK